MKTRSAIAVALMVMLCGCGGKKEPSAADTAPFKAAIVEYLRIGTMDMKPDKFESLEVKGKAATAKVRMATKDDLYGLKPLWTFSFMKVEGGSWKVFRHEN